MKRFYIIFLIFISFLFYWQGCDTLVTNDSKPEVPSDHTVKHGIFLHKNGERTAAGCDECHGQDLTGGVQTYDGRYIFVQSCYQCHGKLWNTLETR